MWNPVSWFWNVIIGPIQKRRWEELQNINDVLKRRWNELHTKNVRLKIEVSIKDDQLYRRNRELDALGMVWCNGGCEGGVFRYSMDTLTKEQVEMVERNTARLRTWFEAKKFRDKQEGE